MQKRAISGEKARIRALDAAFCAGNAAPAEKNSRSHELIPRPVPFALMRAPDGHSADNGKEFIMKALLIASSALALIATPASAQLLGGGLGGSLGGSLGGGLTGGLGGTMGSIGSATSGTLDGAARTSGSHKVDRRSGTVSVDRTVNGTVGGAVDSTLDTPSRSVGGKASGNASGNANANGNAQLIGTDAVRGVAGSTRSTVGSVAGSARGTLGGAAGAAGSTAGSASGSAQGSGSSAGSASSNHLAAAQSAAASATGAFAVVPGMDILSAKGEAIGSVRRVISDSHGQVQSLLVEVDDRSATLPAANFSGSGNALVSGMTEGQIKKVAKAQSSGDAAAEGKAKGEAK
jgi:hypothetical protein